MKLVMIIVLLGICSAGPKKQKNPAPPQASTSSYQMPVPGLFVQI